MSRAKRWPRPRRGSAWDGLQAGEAAARCWLQHGHKRAGVPARRRRPSPRPWPAEPGALAMGRRKGKARTHCAAPRPGGSGAALQSNGGQPPSFRRPLSACSMGLWSRQPSGERPAPPGQAYDQPGNRRLGLTAVARQAALPSRTACARRIARDIGMKRSRSATMHYRGDAVLAPTAPRPRQAREHDTTAALMRRAHPPSAGRSTSSPK
jgi:hypothetical protein